MQFFPIGIRGRMTALALLSLLAAPPARADSVEDFYRGKSITMLVASGAGGGYDAYARVFARYAQKHIPGNPGIVAKNMPAAAGLAAASTLFNNADKDGLTIAALTNVVALDPLFGNPAARFDAQKFGWIGSIGKLQNVCATWHTSPVKTIEDARRREVIVAGAGASSNTAVVPKIINELLGTKFKLVSGYDPAGGLTLAVESGEAEGICGLSWSTMKASRPDWIASKKLNVLVQMSMEKLPELGDVPSALDLISDPDKKKVLELILIRQEMGRPFATSPGVPADRLAALRKAFDATMKDPEFLAEAAKTQLEVEPLSGAQIETFLASAYGAPAAVVAQAAALVEPAAAPKKP
ncbi:MAG: tripartite tricarboxylate transporter family receptor [Hyphomicrobiales bacterium]|nr:tripartite tricarboxylate transporter family receptor [Hyphomicrobiales bacterium]